MAVDLGSYLEVVADIARRVRPWRRGKDPWWAPVGARGRETRIPSPGPRAPWAARSERVLEGVRAHSP